MNAWNGFDEAIFAARNVDNHEIAAFFSTTIARIAAELDLQNIPKITGNGKRGIFFSEK